MTCTLEIKKKFNKVVVWTSISKLITYKYWARRLKKETPWRTQFRECVAIQKTVNNHRVLKGGVSLQFTQDCCRPRTGKQEPESCSLLAVWLWSHFLLSPGFCFLRGTNSIIFNRSLLIDYQAKEIGSHGLWVRSYTLQPVTLNFALLRWGRGVPRVRYFAKVTWLINSTKQFVITNMTN